jgi:hypothetical protein
MVARWYEYFHSKNVNFWKPWNGKFWYIFMSIWFFINIWYIFRRFGIFYDNLVPILYCNIVSLFPFCIVKNLATQVHMKTRYIVRFVEIHSAIFCRRFFAPKCGSTYSPIGCTLGIVIHPSFLREISLEIVLPLTVPKIVIN